LQHPNEDDVFDAADEDERDEDEAVEKEASQQVALGVAGVYPPAEGGR
jgi:hypothetical protein